METNLLLGFISPLKNIIAGCISLGTEALTSLIQGSVDKPLLLVAMSHDKKATASTYMSLPCVVSDHSVVGFVGL